jgi:hypothetical protein
VADLLRAEGVDRRRRGQDRRTREESGELRTDLATSPRPRRDRRLDEAFPRNENAHLRAPNEPQPFDPPERITDEMPREKNELTSEPRSGC